ncbi:MFS transporter [Pseudonocardia sp. KRD-184]|uniref:MFS transporter n=1 Tax=Pseudonocardia oceani TaxID=2792013 RepID=A0ABS6UFU4_9PSEU|nr:MFS transporter [Pseudonocardia oceani]MBW0091697.1 MFS transporter [Pseudonocardia oceani]MBW0098812.1 MFS transporter [Pseudonocardia oceani]MBW0111296.1 MFS transporter [Pseudonocardia oceani]MBW0125105.1 MFS transporter [Pseudonocardia oceani]MBW0131100.1 MFS transporter [Pseudonocardia oceani]
MADRALGQVFAVREYRTVWIADLLSVAGDQLARVALAVLVYGRTGSAAWAAATYALTFLPAIVGGVLLSGLADRFPRREVLVVTDVARAGLVAVMALPQVPLAVLCALLVVVVLLGAPHTAARGALLPELLPGDLYERGLAVSQITGQTAQVVGFAAGGLLVAAVSPSAALLLDAVTFLVAGLLFRLGLARRPRADAAPRSPGRDLLAGVVDVATDRRRRALVLLVWMVGLYVVPEALAAPYADQIGAGPAVVGLLMAADPLGSVLGAWLFVRFVPPRWRERLIGVLAVAAGVPLLFTALVPPVPVALLLWGVSGMASTAYVMQAQASFVRATPAAIRGRAIGVAASGIVAGQGVAVLAGGVLADLSTPSTAIALCAAAGVVVALGGALAWRSASADDHATRPLPVTT